MSQSENPTQLKYQKVEEAVRLLVDNAEEGTRLPSERELAAILKVSFLTVRRGLLPLVNDGSIERRSGAGTYVSSKTKRKAPLTSASPVFSGKIGVLIFRDSDAYAHKVLHGIDEVASSENLELRHAWITDLGSGAIQRVQDLKNEGVKTLILPWIPPRILSEASTELYNFLNNSPLPITIRSLIPGLEEFCCTPTALYGLDLIASTDVLCSYFNLLGHKRIALLGPDDIDDLLIQKKLAGYIQFVCKKELESLVGLVSPAPDAMMRIAERWSQFRGDLAIVSYDDTHALRFMEAMGILGLSAPKDFTIIGFNNIDAGRYSQPPLTTVSPDYTNSVRDLLRAAISAVTGVRVRRQEKAPYLSFIVRDTCGGSRHVEKIMQTMGDSLNIITEH